MLNSSLINLRRAASVVLTAVVAAAAFSPSVLAKKPYAEWVEFESTASPNPRDLLEGANGGGASVSRGAGGPGRSQASLPQNVEGSFKECLQFLPPNFSLRLSPAPQARHPGRLRALCFSDFAVLHSGETRTPTLVFERLTASLVRRAQDQERVQAFHAEARLPIADRASLEDYAGSGFDRGHMAPSGDFATPEGREQSNSLANVVPQHSEMNRGPWSQIEQATRKYALRHGESPVWVVTGPVFNRSAPTYVGSNGRVRVPSQIFKMVIVNYPSPRSWVYLLDNAPASGISPPIGPAEFEARTGIRISD